MVEEAGQLDTTVPEIRKATDLAADTAVFAKFLKSYGLPTKNIIASSDERRVLATNLPEFFNSLPPEEKRDARYLSKFVGATAVGLFDAALNYIWNEVVINLRKKAIVYGLDLFFDAAVGGNNRASYKDEDDLGGLKDSVLLNTCRKIELISDIVYRKLDHILTMRNELAASHPNVESIGGFELLGWLQTCVKDVLQDRPSDSAIRIKSLIDNLKSRKTDIDNELTIKFSQELKNLSLPHVHNLLIAIFGMFVAQDTDQILRKNIAQIAPSVWNCSEEEVRYRIGILLDGYRSNLQEDKLAKGIEFLIIVNGRMYESLSSRIIILEKLADRLEEAHEGWDNFYHEPPIMRETLQFIRKSTDIPSEVLNKLVKVVLRCRIGRGLSYREGVSPAGLELYNKFFSIVDDNGIAFTIKALFRPEINSKLTVRICQKHLGAVLSILKSRVISDRLKGALDFLLSDIENAHCAYKNPEFRKMTSSFIRWLI